MDIYIQRNGQIQGPFSQGVYQKRFELGELQPDDLVSMDQKTWYPVSRLADPAPVEEGRWKREHKCIKCGASFHTVTFGSLKVTDCCEECTSKRSTKLSVIMLVVALVGGVAFKLWDDHQEQKVQAIRKSQSEFLNKAFSENLILDDNEKPVRPKSTPSAATKENNFLPSSKSPFPVRDKPLNPSILDNTSTFKFSSDHSATKNKSKPKLGSSETDFKDRYGEPEGILHAGPIETDTFIYALDNQLFRVGFWQGQAQHIAVSKLDYQPLTDAEIAKALDTFTEQKDWHRVTDEDGKHMNVWVASGAVALMNDFSHKTDSGEDVQATCFRMMTMEFFEEYKRLALPK